MSAPTIAIVDYGMGNRRSVEKALARVGAHAVITDDHAKLRSADGLLLPGVGAFPAAMAVIGQRGLDTVIADCAAAGTPIFGSCLGMQLLFERSEEHGGAEGLGLLAGTVTRLRAPGLKLPHIGWSAVHWRKAGQGAAPAALGAGLPDPTFLYHVHSFVAWPTDEELLLAVANYGEPFAAVVGKGNVWGTQSHPEKSSTQGLRLLASFAAMCGDRAQGGGAHDAGADTVAAA
jgi:glutamine amidotransferase